jgi:CheY-like chemotaxis protein
MQNMSGFELARRLKELNPETRLLFTTAYEVPRNQIEKELIPLLYPVSASKAGIIKKESALIIPKPAKTGENTSIGKGSVIRLQQLE